ncbi:MAG: AraC family transcriptional regulator [Blautia marasmi]
MESSEFTSIFSKLISANIDKYQQKETQDQALLSPLECQELFFRLLSFVQVFQPQRNSSELLAANIMEYILQNFHTQLTLESIADYFNFHPVHIIRCLKREYGITPNKAIIQIRVDNAKKCS